MLSSVAHSSFSNHFLQGPISVWDAANKACVDSETTRNRLAYLVGFVVLVVYLGLAVVGIWNERNENGGFWSAIFHQVRRS